MREVLSRMAGKTSTRQTEVLNGPPSVNGITQRYAVSVGTCDYIPERRFPGGWVNASDKAELIAESAG